MTLIRNTHPGRRWSWRSRDGQFVSQAAVQAAKYRACVDLVFAMLSELPYGLWPATNAIADHQDLACNLALQGLPVAAGVRPARRAKRLEAADSAVAWGWKTDDERRMR